MGRVARYEGIEALATAGADVLSDDSIDAAVIQGLHEEAATMRRVAAKLPVRERDSDSLWLAQNMAKVLPVFNELDRTVAAWWANQQTPAGYSFVPQIQSAWLRHRGIPAHFDIFNDLMPIDGPLTFSLRLDTHVDNLRTFYAKRYPGLLAFSELIPSQTEGILNRQNQITNTIRRVGNTGMSKILQDPGDMVLMMNYPVPTLHAVDTVHTLSLVGTYNIIPPGVNDVY